MKTYHYDGLYRSTFTNQLPFGEDIIRGAYREGYDWACSIRQTYDPTTYLEEWLADDGDYQVLSKLEYEELIKTRDWKNPIPSEETLTLLDALRNGAPPVFGLALKMTLTILLDALRNDTPRPYSRNGSPDSIGQFDTSKLADDIDWALWEGAYDGYIDTCYEAARSLGIELKEVE